MSCQIKNLHFINSSDDERVFPSAAFAILTKEGYLNPIECFEIDLNIKYRISMTYILKVLKRVGYLDLSVGRLLEGHYNALILILHYGTEEQKAKSYKDVQQGQIFGVWNTERDFEGVHTVYDDGANEILKGSKIFCSGSIFIRPIVTVKRGGDTYMVHLSKEHMRGLKPDWSLWDPMGMRSSVSSRIDLSGMIVRDEDIIGNANHYFEEPYFHGGAIRFSAVQLGGAKRIGELAIDFLKSKNRTNDPFQIKRIAEMQMLLTTANLWIEKAAQRMDNINKNTIGHTINFADMTRTVVCESCIKVLELAERSVGLQGLMRSNEMERWHRDLSTYLKQPGPDATTVRIGKFYLTNS